jgi:uncharacterized protein YbaR (Trm112 family)
MSIENDPDSPYYQYKRNRFKVNNLTWNSSYTERLFCKPCYSSGLGRLIPSPKADEKDKLYCRNCGKSYDISDIDDQQKETKLGMKHGETQNTPILISQKRNDKRKPKFDSVNNELTDEDKQDIRNSGGLI